ncbi:hypothetical protein fugu_006667 [Takifugu bimaculatus]|uniref:G-protein coupled receptors family 1 profile domain-containing protein n=1 Tax=Takifugu bimaculatus TaxID=433685 RepID=A0A4Z2B2T6_9TELE|nr:hypothetical protein fugu_006667 [Takifugu bimaculatus]
MAWSFNLWLCLLVLTDAKSVRQQDSQGPGPDLDKTSSAAKLDSFWKHFGSGDDILNHNRLLPEMLDLDQHRRLARGADEDEQQSTFGRSFENDFVTAPQPTELNNITKLAGGDPRITDNLDLHGNTSISDQNAPGLLNPFFLVESSYVAYAVLFLAGLVLAVGVVGNMAVMCIVWNNYYMRSAWNYLLASMAFWDFLVLVLCLPVIVLNQLSHRRILGDITCRMVPYMESVSLGVASFTLCALGIDRFHAATSSSLPNVRRVERCRSVLLKLLLVWLAALLLSSPEIFLWQLSQDVSPSTGQLADSCTITPTSSLTLYLP